MAKFSFRLQDFLRLRERIEEQKKQEYGLAVAKLEREKQIRDALYREKDNNVDSFRSQIQKQEVKRLFSAFIQVEQANAVPVLNKRVGY